MIDLDAKHLYEWMLNKPIVDYCTLEFEYILYYNNCLPSDCGYKVNNVLYNIKNPYCFLDLFYNKFELYDSKNSSHKIDISNISTEILDEELFQLSTVCDISMFKTEDLKYLIKTCRLLSN